MTIYLLPGIACDHRLFDKLELDQHNVVKLDWPRFAKGCSLADIAKDLSHQVDVTQRHMLVGVSMGGMVAQELALITTPERVVLISTWTHPREWPWFVRAGTRLPLGAFINAATMHASFPLKRILGSRDAESDRLLREMALKEGVKQLRRGAQAILRWKGTTWSGPTARIHGDRDVLMPLAKLEADHVVHGGTHAMVLCQAQAVSAALRTALTT